MSELKANKFESKTGLGVIIRSAVKEDAQEIYKLAKSVIDEEIYQLTASDEFNLTLEAEEKWIEAHRNSPNHIILIAEVNGSIVGMLDFSNGHRKRIAHTGEFGMSVVDLLRNQGIGSLLIESLIRWASQNKVIEKIGLNVHANNDRAIALYKKMGFQIEGVRKRDLKYGDDHYVDTVVMGRFV